MTDYRVNEAIAEAIGWERNVIDRDMQGNFCPRDTPSFCNDLNAMHEAERVLFTGSQKLRWKYVAELHISAEPTGWGNYAGAHATARQRAEAFLRTIGKWQQ